MPKIYDIIIPLTGDKYLQQLAATSGIFIAFLMMCFEWDFFEEDNATLNVLRRSSI